MNLCRKKEGDKTEQGSDVVSQFSVQGRASEWCVVVTMKQPDFYKRVFNNNNASARGLRRKGYLKWLL